MSNIQQIEVSLTFAKEQVKAMDDLASLFNNRAFTKVISNGFFRDYPAELVRSLADPVISDNPAKHAEVLRDLAGISVLHGYLQRINLLGTMAEKAIKDGEDELEYLRTNPDAE